MSKERYNIVLRATSLFGSVQGLGIALNIVRTKIVAVLLGPEGVGLNSIYNESRELLHSTTNFGLDVSGVRGVSKAYEEWQGAEDDKIRTVLRNKVSSEVALLRSWVLLLALLGTFLCMVLATPLSLFTFGDYEHSWGYVFLSPAVGFSTVTCGELAVLKGLRKLRWLASISLLNVVLGICISIPIYYVWGKSGVLGALVAVSLLSMLMTCAYGYKAEKIRFIFSKKEMRRGNKMLSVGFNFVVCSIIGHLSLLGVQAYLNNFVSAEMVGLYNSGYTLTMTYAGMIFAAMDSDYFPRLSGVVTNIKERTNTLLEQLDVVVILIVPLLAAMTVALPVLVPLFLDTTFKAIIPMTQLATMGLLFRAVYLPNAYLSLAAGDNKTFLSINIVGALDLLLVIAGYYYGGLTGMGIALTVQNFIDMALVMAISRWKYGVCFTWNILVYLCLDTVLLLLTCIACFTLEGWRYWLAGASIIVLTILHSLYRYKKA